MFVRGVSWVSSTGGLQQPAWAWAWTRSLYIAADHPDDRICEGMETDVVLHGVFHTVNRIGEEHRRIPCCD